MDHGVLKDGVDIDWATLAIALIGAITGVIALTWQILNDVRRVKVTFLGSRILLLNHTKRPVNIDAVGFHYRNGTSWLLTEPKFESLCTIPAEDQKDVDVGDVKWAQEANYVFARDVLGHTYKGKISKEDIAFFMKDRKSN